MGGGPGAPGVKAGPEYVAHDLLQAELQLADGQLDGRLLARVRVARRGWNPAALHGQVRLLVHGRQPQCTCRSRAQRASGTMLAGLLPARQRQALVTG